MSKGREFRPPRRRGFDDDMFSPRYNPNAGPPARRDAPRVEGPTVDATVKWFNPEKGFGFAELADGSGDAFLHVAVLQSAGKDSVAPGTKMKVNVGQGMKGRQITAVTEVDESTATEEPRRSAPRPGGFGGGGGGFGGGAGGGQRRGAPDPSTAVDLNGTVKWFNGTKGFGFVQAEDGGKDVFLHVSVLQKAGLTDIAEGQRVAMKVVDTQKGREAISMSIA